MKLKPVSHPGSKNRAAFTLIELLVVIAIIAILASLILATSGYVQEKSGIARATTEIKALETALESYKQDRGSYPTGSGADTGDDTSTKVLIQELYIKPSDSGSNPDYANLKPFPFNKNQLSTYKAGTGQTFEAAIKSPGCYLVDPFGNPYHYKFPGDPKRSGADFFDLWSKGKKNQGGDDSNDTNVTIKWIKNW